jgi:hypothetical protein
VARRGGGTAGIGQRSGGDEPDMQGMCAKGRGERRRVSERRNSIEKMYSEEYTKGTRADKAGRGEAACGERVDHHDRLGQFDRTRGEIK